MKKTIFPILAIGLMTKGLGKTIIGEYFAWSEEDANCCPSGNGTFEYNPTELTTEIKN